MRDGKDERLALWRRVLKDAIIADNDCRSACPALSATFQRPAHGYEPRLAHSSTIPTLAFQLIKMADQINPSAEQLQLIYRRGSG